MPGWPTLLPFAALPAGFALGWAALALYFRPRKDPR